VKGERCCSSEERWWEKLRALGVNIEEGGGGGGGGGGAAAAGRKVGKWYYHTTFACSILIHRCSLVIIMVWRLAM